MTFVTISLVALTVSLLALVTAVFSAFKIRANHRHRSLEKRVHEAEISVLECLDALQKVEGLVKRINSRHAMRDSRAKKASNGAPDPQQDPEGWKKHMMKKHVLGKEF